MEMLVLREGNPIEIANMFLMMMRGEDYLKSDSVLLLKSDYFKISSTEKINMSIDGEKGPMLPIEVEVRKQAIEVFVPKTKL
ncbi:MAG: diacylglycerol kinase, partial [Acetoanaerobium sp.]|nr:diacylglycerol kinase [Acetoanaerobium sp.]